MSITGPRLQDLHGATLLIGSGLSGEASNGLPAGGIVAAAIFERLFAYSGRQDGQTIWRRWAWSTPFEQLLNGHPDPDMLDEVFRLSYAGTTLNEWQIKLAHLVREGHVGAIITTNYDCCLEAALAQADVDYLAVVLEQDKPRPEQLPFFKIHGSVDRREEPLVLSLRQEGMLAPWKEELFRALCRDKPVYVIGYSGRDFDICPVLLDTAYRDLYWLDLPDRTPTPDVHELSANLRFAVEHPEKVKRFSRVRGTFSDLLDIKNEFIPARDGQSVVDRVFAQSSRDAFAYGLWAAELFQAISCRSVAQDVFDRLEPPDAAGRARVLQLRSDLEERRGAYRTSAATLSRVAKEYEALEDWNEAIRASVQIAWRMYTGLWLGKFLMACWRASRYVAFVRKKRCPALDETLAESRLAYLMVLRYAALKQLPVIRKLVRLPAVRRRILARASPGLAAFRARGLWQEHYLLAKQLEGLRLADDAATRHRLLPSTLGFGQLGNLVGDASAYRNGVARTSSRSEALLDGLSVYGLDPEYWKFHSEVRQDLTPEARHIHTATKALEAYGRCQLGISAYILNAGKLCRLYIAELRSRYAAGKMR
ncbi:hypothetical protein GPL17_35980 [Bradyrhizobium yuanmingense]|uniref:SIR2 family protein n=1 Tax=Bradyrhizobium yuanmingense TaxID=108015 RepID=UPI0012FAFBFA|nr:SIR2 family protein [Bradyrhizobium yuanmingense]MVT55799.1 hypothetical protein [Bradyrhizobium yuanmingense]